MHLTRREKIFLGFGALYLLFIGGYFFLNWYQEKIDLWEKEYLSLLDERRKIEEMGRRYQFLKKLQLPYPQEDLLTEIENLLQNYQLREYATSILPAERYLEERKYKKRSLQIHFKPLPIDKFLPFIEAIEKNYPTFQVERLHIRKFYQKEGYYYVSLRVVQFSRS